MRIKLFLLLLVLLGTVALPSYTRGSDPEQDPSASSAMSITRAELILFAKQFLGTPYHFASSSPKNGFDCSGFVKYVFNNFKISLPHASREFDKLGTALKPKDFKVGDVVIFYGFKDKSKIGHVGIICEADGMKSKFIHSSSGKVHAVTISDLGSGMYTRRFYKCINVFNEGLTGSLADQ